MSKQPAGIAAAELQGGGAGYTPATGDKLRIMNDDLRRNRARDRRAHPRGGRRADDAQKPWYLRRRTWLAAASLVFVGVRRLKSLGSRHAPA